LQGGYSTNRKERGYKLARVIPLDCPPKYRLPLCGTELALWYSEHE